MIFSTIQIKEVATLLLEGKIGILPTDTVYGIHCLALNSTSIERVYAVKQRPEVMPFITLISETRELELFGVVPDEFVLQQLNEFWPAPNTLVLKTITGDFRSFRVTNYDFINSILRETGPLLSTSANVHGQPCINNIEEAVSVFGDKVDFYVDAGELHNKPSSVYKLSNGEVTKLR